jgi:hypothetical protein
MTKLGISQKRGCVPCGVLRVEGSAVNLFTETLKVKNKFNCSARLGCVGLALPIQLTPEATLAILINRNSKSR